MAVFVDGDVGQRRFGDFHAFAGVVGARAALGVDRDVDGNRGVAGADDLGVEADHVVDEHRLFELKGVDRHGGDAPVGAAAGDD